jgi:hypothetical protein
MLLCCKTDVEAVNGSLCTGACMHDGGFTQVLDFHNWTYVFDINAKMQKALFSVRAKTFFVLPIGFIRANARNAHMHYASVVI